MNAKPVVVLAFSNDRDAYLDMILREQKNIYKTLRAFKDKDYIQIEQTQHTSIDEFFDVFQRYNNRVAIFHYGGHASGSHLQFESLDGAHENANAEGLTQLIGLQENLKLVFLNGCATYGQVDALLQAGVKAVIATTVAVNDTKATEFAEQFYRALATGKVNIGKAFRSAKAFIATKYSSEISEVKKAKGLKLRRKKKSADPLPWGLYTEDEKALLWKLPTMAHNQLIMRGGGGSGPAKKSYPVNKKLISTLFKSLSKYNDELEFLLMQAKKKGKMDARLVRRAIIDSYPVPIGEQIRKLLAGNNINEERLKQTVRVYDVTLQLLCYSMLSQLWDIQRDDEKEVEIEEDDLVGFNSFLSLNKENYTNFDYAELMDAVANIFDKNEIPFFVEEMSKFNQLIQEGGKLNQSHKFMMEMKQELEDGVAASEIDSFCQQAENHLTAIMSMCSFFISYKMITIKDIRMVKKRHSPVVYKINNVMLDRVTAGVLDDVLEKDVYTDDKSVILVKNVDEIGDFLNLTPFVIDENALTGDEKSKIFYYSYKEGEEYHYHFIDNEEEDLTISEEIFEDMYSQMAQFQSDIFEKKDDVLDFDSLEDDEMDFSLDDDDDDFELF